MTAGAESLAEELRREIVETSNDGGTQEYEIARAAFAHNESDELSSSLERATRQNEKGPTSLRNDNDRHVSPLVAQTGIFEAVHEHDEEVESEQGERAFVMDNNKEEDDGGNAFSDRDSDNFFYDASAVPEGLAAEK